MSNLGKISSSHTPTPRDVVEQAPESCPGRSERTPRVEKRVGKLRRLPKKLRSAVGKKLKPHSLKKSFRRARHVSPSPQQKTALQEQRDSLRTPDSPRPPRRARRPILRRAAAARSNSPSRRHSVLALPTKRKQLVSANEYVTSKNVSTYVARLASAESVEDIRFTLKGLTRQERISKGESELIKRACKYVKVLEKDMKRIDAFAQEFKAGHMTPEQYEVFSSLLCAHKGNLSLVQGILGRALDESLKNPLTPSSAKSLPLLRALELRLAERHVEIADAVSMFLDEVPTVPTVMSTDKFFGDLVVAEGFLEAVRWLGEDLEIEEGELRPLLADLNRHCKALQKAADARKTLVYGAQEEVSVSEKPPISLAERQGHIKDLEANWSAQLQKKRGAIKLPLAHNVLSQKEMLQAFVRFRLQHMRGGDVPADSFSRLGFLSEMGAHRAINGRGWGVIRNSINVRLGGAPQNFVSEIEPAGARLKKVGAGYEGAGVGSQDRLQHKHIPNLAVSSVRAQDGTVLFSGLRHGVADPYGITPEFLRGLKESRLERLVQELYWEDSMRTKRLPDALAFTRELQKKNSTRQLGKVAEVMRRKAAEKMVNELAVLSLSSDGDKYRRALAGETVTLPINSISLVRPRRGGSMFRNQQAAIKKLGNAGKPVTLMIKDREGAWKGVSVRLEPHVFSYDLREQKGWRKTLLSTPLIRSLVSWFWATPLQDPALTHLVGSSRTSVLGGQVNKSILQMREERDEWRSVRERLSSRAVPDERGVAELNGRIEASERKERLMLNTALQIKQMWRGRGDQMEMASRVALLCHMMGESVSYHCRSGLEGTSELDTQIKYLASRGYVSGELPGVGGVPDEEALVARDVFAREGGNASLERYNQGLPTG